MINTMLSKTVLTLLAIAYVAGENAVSKSDVRKVLDLTEDEFQALYDEFRKFIADQTPFILIEAEDSFLLGTAPEYGDAIKKVLKISAKKGLSQASLETVTVIAYKQPIEKSIIDEIRRVDSEKAILNLIEKKLIRIIGYKENKPGRPALYGTTKEFLYYFGLKDLSELPAIKLTQSVGQLEQIDSPSEDQSNNIKRVSK